MLIRNLISRQDTMVLYVPRNSVKLQKHWDLKFYSGVKSKQELTLNLTTRFLLNKNFLGSFRLTSKKALKVMIIAVLFLFAQLAYSLPAPLRNRQSEKIAIKYEIEAVIGSVNKKIFARPLMVPEIPLSPRKTTR